MKRYIFIITILIFALVGLHRINSANLYCELPAPLPPVMVVGNDRAVFDYLMSNPLQENITLVEESEE